MTPGHARATAAFGPGHPQLVSLAPGKPTTDWSVRVPGSKSITNRALLLAALAPGTSTIEAPLIADDTLAMLKALAILGVVIRELGDPDAPTAPADANADVNPTPSSHWSLTGLGGPPTGPCEVWTGQGATVSRFLIPVLAAGQGDFWVDAHPQMRRRPIGPILDCLREQGATIDGDHLPITIHARGLSGGELAVDSSVSSQFLSGLLMAAPLAGTTTSLHFDALVSHSYIDLTLDAMAHFGVTATREDGAITVAPQPYEPTNFSVEPDASTASYFLASAALTGTTVTLPGVDLDSSRQGDFELVELLERMGAVVSARRPLALRGPNTLRGITANMSNSSDVFMTLACVAPFADSPTTIEGIGHTRVKESDRITATAENLRRVGIRVEETPDSITIHPGPVHSARLPTYGDHRIAMAFSLIATHAPIELEAPEVVAKTCPEFFELWRATGADVKMLDTSQGE